MRYTLDCEFSEGLVKYHDGEETRQVFSLELISIGLVCEDGREFYACNNEYRETLANDFVKEQVLPKLPPKDAQHSYWYHPSEAAVKERLQEQGPVWMSRGAIAQAIYNFMRPDIDDRIKLYAYYAAYDHVAFASLWGSMIAMPKGMPWYTYDLKCMAEALRMHKDFYPSQLPKDKEHIALEDARWDMQLLKAIGNFQYQLL
jgi:hypothetical protein